MPVQVLIQLSMWLLQFTGGLCFKSICMIGMAIQMTHHTHQSLGVDVARSPCFRPADRTPLSNRSHVMVPDGALAMTTNITRHTKQVSLFGKRHVVQHSTAY